MAIVDDQKATLVVEILKMLYKSFLRDVLAKAVKDSSSPIDDMLFKVVDSLLG